MPAKGEPAWPPLAMFKALLLSIWYDLSDVKLAEALDDRASFRLLLWLFGNGGDARADRVRPLSQGSWSPISLTARCSRL